MLKNKMNVKEIGIKGEYEFIRRLNLKGIPYIYADVWYDFEVLKEMIDVKTTLISHKFTNHKRKNQCYKIGRFTFTDEQLKNNIYYAFFVRYKEEFLFLGIGKLKNKIKHLSIHKVRELNLLTLDEFIDLKS